MRKLRPQLSYANVMSTLAVFLLLAGGGAYAAGKLKKNSVKSKHIAAEAVTGDDANEATFGKVPSAGSADNAANADGVPANAISAADIQDEGRSLSIPLGSFRNATAGGTALDTDSGDDLTAPDFEMDSGSLTISFDEDVDGPINMADEHDTDTIISTLTIPQDYAGGQPLLVVAATKSGNTGATERLRCNTTINGGPVTGLVEVNVTSSAFVSYVFPLEGAYGTGVAVDVRCHVTDGSNGSLWDEEVQLRAVELRYSAEQ